MKKILIINRAFNTVVDSVEEAISIAKSRYKDVFFQECQDTIEVRNLITEHNGYQHESKEILFSCHSSKFWAK